MNDMERNAYRGVINARLEIALKGLRKNPKYIERCHQQEKSGELVEELLHQLEKDDRITIRRHYEGEIAKECDELNEAYVQGLRDCMKFLMFLDVFHTEVFL